jgi:PAS domain S-box-containing protein
MQDSRKTKPQLLAELETLREEVRRHIAAETEAAQAEEAMWQTQVALLALFNNLPGMAYRTAFDASHPNGRVEFVSGGCLKLTGYPAAAYVNDPLLYRQQVMHPDDRQRVMAAIAEAQARRQPHHVTYRIVTRGGDLRWMDENGTAMFDAKGDFVAREGFITDVTERVTHLHDLSRQHTELQKLTRAVEQAGELIVIGDAAGAIQYVNQAFERLTGYRRDEVIGRAPREAAGGPDERNLFRRIRLALRGGETWRGRYSSRRKDGSLLELECTASPVFSPEGHFEGYVAVQRDTGKH